MHSAAVPKQFLELYGKPGIVGTREDSFVTGRDLAERFLARAGGAEKVAFDGAGESAHGYAPEMQIRLLTAKLKAPGWRARFDLDRMLDDLLEWYRAIRPTGKTG